MALIPFRNQIALILGRLWLATWRIQIEYATGDLPSQGILVLWHEHFPVGLKAFANKKVLALFSPSRDGKLAGLAAQQMGYNTRHGSSSRGGVAGLLAVLRLGKREGGLIGMALDGPRGPRRIAKPGTLWLAQKLNFPILPIGVVATRYFRLKNWDRSLIPFPFSRVQVFVGKPLTLEPEEDTALGLEKLCGALEKAEQGAKSLI